MMDDSTLPVPIGDGGNRVSTLDQLAEIPEEEIWLQKQKSALPYRPEARNCTTRWRASAAAEASYPSRIPRIVRSDSAMSKVCGA